MAGRGPAPKEQRTRERDNHQFTDLSLQDRAERIPPLPNAKKLSAATKAWYKTWAESPQAAHFVATDWQRLQMLAELVEQYFSAPTKELLGEIRLNEAKFGATPEDRLRIRWRFDAQEQEEELEAKRTGKKPATSRQRKDPRHLKAV